MKFEIGLPPIISTVPGKLYRVSLQPEKPREAMVESFDDTVQCREADLWDGYRRMWQRIHQDTGINIDQFHSGLHRISGPVSVLSFDLT
jgi:hypothetical protein